MSYFVSSFCSMISGLLFDILFLNIKLKDKNDKQDNYNYNEKDIDENEKKD